MIDSDRDAITRELDRAIDELEREAQESGCMCRPFVTRRIDRLQAEKAWVTTHDASSAHVLQTRAQ